MKTGQRSRKPLDVDYIEALEDFDTRKEFIHRMSCLITVSRVLTLPRSAKAVGRNKGFRGRHYVVHKEGSLQSPIHLSRNFAGAQGVSFNRPKAPVLIVVNRSSSQTKVTTCMRLP